MVFLTPEQTVLFTLASSHKKLSGIPILKPISLSGFSHEADKNIDTIKTRITMYEKDQ